MQANILVAIPNKCYISADYERDFPCEFYLKIAYGNIPKENITITTESAESAVSYPQITISGFEKLLADDTQFEKFVKELKQSGDLDWTIKKATKSNSIIICYTGVSLKENFFFSASTNSFVLDTKENQTVVLTVTVENFPDIENNKYSISTKVDYAPFAKSLSFNKSPVELKSNVEVSYEYLGDNVDKILMQNGSKVDTPRSPFTAYIDKPTNFTLWVFNKSGIDDIKQKFLEVFQPQITSFTADKDYFSKGDAVNLKWSGNSVSNYILDNVNEKTDTLNETDAIVYPVAEKGSYNVEYRLVANGYKGKNPTSVNKTITLTQTSWISKKIKSGYFSTDEAYTKLDFNSRVFCVGKVYYAYAHPNLYKSSDGIAWSIHSTNSKANIDFICIATDYNNGIIYAMGNEGKDGERLYISTYDFSKSTWDYLPAYQFCNSTIGSFAFSNQGMYYAQISKEAIIINRRGEDNRWNVGNKVIKAPKDQVVIGGDYCFYKDSFYAVMLCENQNIYVYRCQEDMEDILFKKSVDKDDAFVSLIATINNLYIVTSRYIIDMRSREVADGFSPMGVEKNKRMWLGVNDDDKLIGIYPDKRFWILDV